MENSKNHNCSLGVNKAIKKETGPAASGHRQPRVYNIRRSDFRSVVQQLTGAPAAALPPGQRRLHQARPPPLSPPVPRAAAAPVEDDPLPPLAAATAALSSSSPVSAYMRFLETSLLHSDGSHQLRPPPPAPAAQQLELIQSPSAFLNLMSPRCPPLSPQPLSLSPSMLFPTSPPAFLLASPSTWKDL